MSKERFVIRNMDGAKALFDTDGKFWTLYRKLGAVCYAPMTVQEIARLRHGKIAFEKDKPIKLFKVPDITNRVPNEVLAYWWRFLTAAFPGESLIVYGKNTEGVWGAIAPKQQVTGASVDVDDFGPSISEFRKAGYEEMGTLHIHPGGMTGCSGTDTGDIWKKFSGLHIIIERGGKIGYYFSLKEQTWKCLEEWVADGDVSQVEPLETVIMNEGGVADIKEVVKAKVYTAISTYQPYNYEDSDLLTEGKWREKYGQKCEDYQVAYMGLTFSYGGTWITAYFKQINGTRVDEDYAKGFTVKYKKNGYYASDENGSFTLSKGTTFYNNGTYKAMAVWIDREKRVIFTMDGAVITEAIKEGLLEKFKLMPDIDKFTVCGSKEQAAARKKEESKEKPLLFLDRLYMDVSDMIKRVENARRLYGYKTNKVEDCLENFKNMLKKGR